ncbi:MAG TPA: hypothetical protein VE988_22880 [Gemmataceae bacterium]|nr:hypothetical protein [Gemmataceae bacterium]
MLSALQGKEPPLKPVIEHLLKQNPFLAFRLHLTSRSQVDVLRPELVEVKDSVLNTYVVDDSEPDKRRLTSVVSLHHVVSVEQLRADKPMVVSGP